MWKGPCEKKFYDMRCIEKCDFFQFFGNNVLFALQPLPVEEIQ
jgi:hypothetical protein